jgi:hypothetical protein
VLHAVNTRPPALSFQLLNASGKYPQATKGALPCCLTPDYLKKGVISPAFVWSENRQPEKFFTAAFYAHPRWILFRLFGPAIAHI